MRDKYKRIPIPVRYLINALLCAAFLVIVQSFISGGSISRYQSGILVQIGVYIIMAVSLNIATGYLGQLPLGHAGFMSIGGYSCAIFMIRLADKMGVETADLLIPGLIFGGCVTALFGLIIGIPALRLKGDYLAIVTLGFAEIIRVFMLNIDSLLGFKFTGGAGGLTGIPRYSNFLNVFISVILVCFFVHTMMKSRHGRAILAIRDNEIAAEASGVNISYYKTLAFVISAFFAGIGGGLYAGSIGVMDPTKFGCMESIEILVMVVLGGMGSMLGSISAATVITVVNQVLTSLSEYRMVIYALLLIVVMMFRPKGLFGTYDFSLSHVMERLFNRDFPKRKSKGARK